MRSEDPQTALEYLQENELQQPILTVNDVDSSSVRDADDILGPVLEVLTSTGKYYWVRWSQILSLEVMPPQYPIDLLWRQASLEIEAGPDGEVFLPSIYSNQDCHEDSVRLGRVTDWSEVAGIHRGRGQKILLAGDTEIPFMELSSIVRKAE